MALLVVSVALLALAAYTYQSSQFEDRELDEVTRSELPGSFVELSNGFTYYEHLERNAHDGDRPETIVLVHGFLVSGISWSRNVAALHDAGFNVLTVDLYGRGYSDRPDIEYSNVDFVEQLRELLDALAITEPVHLVGSSAGAPVVAALTRDHSDRVASVALIDPRVTNPSPDDMGWMDTPVIGKLLMEREIPGLVRLIGDSYPEWRQAYADQARFEGYADAVRRIQIEWSRVDVMQIYDDFSATQQPTLLLWAAQDRNVGLADELHQRIAGSELQLIADSTHGAGYHQPEAVNTAIIDFINRVAAGQAGD